jgi:hypothetical protein
MANINSGVPIRFENGGILTLTESGGSADTVLLIEAGTLTFKPGGREAIVYKDRGTLATSAVEGDERPTEVSFDIKIAPGAFVDSGQVFKRLAVVGSSGVSAKFSVVVSFPDARGAIVGDRITFAHCVLQEQPEYTAGGENDGLDHLKIKMIDLEAFPVAASY